MKRVAADSQKREKGFIIVITAIAAVVLVGFAGLAIDAGYMEWVQRRVQIAADSAAVAAVLDLKNGGNSNSAVTAGRSLAADNGFTHSGNTVVTIANPPTFGAHAGDNTYVDATVSTVVPTMFMQIMGQNSVTVRARAAARFTVSSGGGNSSGCVYALNPTANRALQVAGSGPLISTYCSWYSNSNHSQEAFQMEGNFTVRLYNNAKVAVVGGWRLNNQNYLKNMPANTNATPVQVTSPGDPLANIPAPTGGTVISATPKYYDMNSRPPSNTLQPGVYCGGLTVGNTNGATYTMNPGTYIIAGGAFNLQSQAKVSATGGVTIYLTNSTGYACNGNYTFNPMTISGQVTFTQKAPTTGPLAGIAIFQDRNVGTSGQQNQINGGSTTVIDGALYFKKSALLFSGSGTNNGYLILVADTIRFNGNSSVTINNDYSTLPGGSPIPSASGGGTASLVE